MNTSQFASTTGLFPARRSGLIRALAVAALLAISALTTMGTAAADNGTPAVAYSVDSSSNFQLPALPASSWST